MDLAALSPPLVTCSLQAPTDIFNASLGLDGASPPFLDNSSLRRSSSEDLMLDWLPTVFGAASTFGPTATDAPTLLTRCDADLDSDIGRQNFALPLAVGDANPISLQQGLSCTVDAAQQQLCGSTLGPNCAAAVEGHAQSFPLDSSDPFQSPGQPASDHSNRLGTPPQLPPAARSVHSDATESASSRQPLQSNPSSGAASGASSSQLAQQAPCASPRTADVNDGGRAAHGEPQQHPAKRRRLDGAAQQAGSRITPEQAEMLRVKAQRKTVQNREQQRLCRERKREKALECRARIDQVKAQAQQLRQQIYVLAQKNETLMGRLAAMPGAVQLHPSGSSDLGGAALQQALAASLAQLLTPSAGSVACEPADQLLAATSAAVMQMSAAVWKQQPALWQAVAANVHFVTTSSDDSLRSTCTMLEALQMTAAQRAQLRAALKAPLQTLELLLCRQRQLRKVVHEAMTTPADTDLGHTSMLELALRTLEQLVCMQSQEAAMKAEVVHSVLAGTFTHRQVAECLLGVQAAATIDLRAIDRMTSGG